MGTSLTGLELYASALYKIQCTKHEVYYQNGQTGGQPYSDTSPLSVPWLHGPTILDYLNFFPLDSCLSP